MSVDDNSVLLQALPGTADLQTKEAAVRAAMIKADPSLASLLEQIKIPEKNPTP